MLKNAAKECLFVIRGTLKSRRSCLENIPFFPFSKQRWSGKKVYEDGFTGQSVPGKPPPLGKKTSCVLSDILCSELCVYSAARLVLLCLSDFPSSAPEPGRKNILPWLVS